MTESLHDVDEDIDDEDNAATDWKSGLAYKRDRAGNLTLKPTLANVVTILANDESWRNVIGYDELAERIHARRPAPWFSDDCPANHGPGPWTDGDNARLTCWLHRRWNLEVSTSMVNEATAVAADRHKFNELVEWLNSLRWDGVARIDTWLATYAGAADNAYTRAVSACWMTSAIARAFDPGCKADTVIVLEGNQGTGKSTLVRTLAHDPAWFFDDDLEVGDKDAAQSLKGKWIVEFGEMHAMSKAEVTSVKAFVSRQADTYRASYARHARTYPRRWVAIGTTNADQYLSDVTGNRRWWPIKTAALDIRNLALVVDLLWAEAVHRYRRGDPWFLTDAEIIKAAETEQAQRVQVDPWQDAIAEWLAKPDRRLEVAAQGFVTTRDILEQCLGFDLDRIERKHEMRVAEALKCMQWARRKFRKNERTIWGYEPPTET